MVAEVDELGFAALSVLDLGRDVSERVWLRLQIGSPGLVTIVNAPGSLRLRGHVFADDLRDLRLLLL